MMMLFRLTALATIVILAAAGPATRPAKEPVVIAGETFRLEPAVTAKARQRGLGGREKIEDHGGMLFVLRDARLSAFYMKDCLIDIDIMFLDDRGRITAVHRMKKEPPRREDESIRAYESRLKLYPSRRPVRFAIELETGSIERLKLKPGRTIPLDLSRLKKLAR